MPFVKILFPLFFLCSALLTGQSPRFIGAGGCASSNCHGATSPASPDESRILGYEYTVWSVRDRHSQAYSVLSENRSKRMAQILAIRDATTSDQCLACHAVGSPEKSRSDGVACEGCHGPAEQWLGPHVAEDQSHEANVALGMIDTKKPELRAALCLECHIGTPQKTVDHELIAAGHPDLVFELDTFSAALPMHWRPVAPTAGNTLPTVRDFAVGQATALSVAMRQLASAATTHWPEFAELECYQCHHELTRDSWRIARGYSERKAGSLVVNISRSTVLEVVVSQVAPSQSGGLRGALDGLTQAVSDNFADGNAVASAARSVQSHADALARSFAGQDFTRAQAVSIAASLSSKAQTIANAGVQSAEQSTMALDTIAAAVANDSQPLKSAIKGLYDYLEHPSVYRPGEYARQLRAAVQQLD